MPRASTGVVAMPTGERARRHRARLKELEQGVDPSACGPGERGDGPAVARDAPQQRLGLRQSARTRHDHAGPGRGAWGGSLESVVVSGARPGSRSVT
jgi:hypothetical protein